MLPLLGAISPWALLFGSVHRGSDRLRLSSTISLVQKDRAVDADSEDSLIEDVSPKA